MNPTNTLSVVPMDNSRHSGVASPATDQFHIHRVIRLPEVLRRTGIARSTVYLGVSAGTFPAPIRLGPNSVGWLESDINTWISDRIAKSRGAGTDAALVLGVAA